jgi:hypothetical protein
VVELLPEQSSAAVSECTEKLQLSHKDSLLDRVPETIPVPLVAAAILTVLYPNDSGLNLSPRR